METRASYVAIGAFVLVVIIGALSSLYWLYRASGTAATETVRIIFPEPVTGLSAGGSVLFNGIRIGEVVSLNFSPEGGDNVVAFIRIDPSAPIKTDTIARLGFTGLTGVAYISLTGGSATAPSLLTAADEGTIPTIIADTSAFTNVLDSAQSVLARMNQTLDEVNGLLRDNRDDVDAVVQNVRTLTQALSDSSPQISGLITDIAGAARSIAAAVPQVSSAVGRADTLLAAIEPARVTSIVENVDTFTAALPPLADEAGSILSNANGVVTRLDQAAGTVGEAVQAVANLVGSIDQDALAAIVNNVRTASAAIAERSGAIGTTIDNAAQITTDVRAVAAVVASRQDEIASALDNATGLVGDIRGAVSAAVPAIENLGNAVAAVTPARITAVVDNVERFTATLAGQSEQIEQLISAATGAATSIDSVAQAIAARREAIDAALGDAAVLAANLRAASERVPGIADQVSARLDEVGTLIRSLDAEAINGVVRDVGTFASALAEQSGALAGLVQSAGNTFARAEVVANTLAERAPQIGSAIENVEATSAAARVFAERLPGLADSLQPGIENISAVLSSIDPEAVRGIVTDARTLATSLAAQAEPIGTLVASARQVASDIEAVTQQLAQRSPQIGVIVDDVAATSAAARVFAERLPGLADSLQPGIENVSAVLSSIDPEAVRGIVTDARTLATSLAAQAEPIGNIIASARQAAADIEAITSAVAQRTPEIEALIGDASAAATAIANAGRTVDGLVTDAAPAVRQLAEAVSVITPARVDDILTNVQLVTGGLARQAPAVEALIADARAVAASARTLAATLEERAPAIGTAIDQAEAAIADVRIAAAGLPQLVTTLQPGVEAFADALSSIDAEAIRAIVANARTVSDTLAAAAPQVQAIIGRVDTASADVAEITTRLRGELDGITAGLDNAEAALASARTFADGLPQLLATVQPGAENLSAALQAIDPAAIEAIVADVRGVTGTVAALRGEIGSTITSASNAAREIERVAATVGQRTEVIGTAIQNAASFVADLAEVGPTVRQAVADVGTAASTIRETVAAIDTTAVNGIIGNVQSAAQEIGSRSAAIGAAIDSATSAARSLAEGLGTVGGEDGTIKEVLERARRIAANLEDASGKIGGVVDRASGLFDGPVQGLVADVSAAAVSVRDVAAAFASRADQIAGGLGRFSSSGLDDLRALINQGRSTLSTIERAVSNFNRDPSRVIFGGSDGPRYAPQRR